MTKIYQNDVGVTVTVNTQFTLTGATTTQLKVKKPQSNLIVTWATTIDGTNAQQLDYTTLVGDLNEAGIYFIQPYVVIGTQTLYGETAQLQVYAPFQ